MQLNYDDLKKGVEGGLGDSGVIDTVTRRAAVAVLFGRGLIQTATEGVAALPSATGFVFEGVSVQRHMAKPNSTGVGQYDANEAISVLRKGRIWVLAETIISPNDGVYLKFSTADGAGGEVGRFRNDVQTLATFPHADLIPGARWITSTTAIDQLALLEINLP